MADKLDRLIKDYVTGNLDRQIQSRVNSITFKMKYKSKPDNLGIRTAYSGGSEQESALLLQEEIDRAIETDSLINEIKYKKYQLETWFGTPDKRTDDYLICEERWKNKSSQWYIAQKIKYSEKTVYRNYVALKKAIVDWGELKEYI